MRIRGANPNGGSAGTRTQDLRLKRPLLYQLSYGIKFRAAKVAKISVVPNNNSKIPKFQNHSTLNTQH